MRKSTAIFFIMGLAVIVIYGLLDPQVFPFPKCPFRTLTGWQCPGCGSQRAIHQALHGHFAQSFVLNPLFLPAALYALLGYGMSLGYPAGWPQIKERYYGIKAGWIALGVITLFWIGRNMI